MNKKGERVNNAQLRETERCLKDFQREKLDVSMSFDACMSADRSNRVLRASERTVTRESKKCDPLAVPPPFAYTDSTTVNTAAVNEARWLTREIFGDPVDDADLATNAANRDKARCQLEMLRRADRLETAVLKELNKAKRRAIREETVDGNAALEAKLWAVFSSNQRINRHQERLADRVSRKCAALPDPPDTIFPGACGMGNPTLSEVEACAIAASRCAACVKTNAFDALNMNCDLADDQLPNGSCP
jgi:hypothetical protein